jgi:hypothetical protein
MIIKLSIVENYLKYSTILKFSSEKEKEKDKVNFLFLSFFFIVTEEFEI